MELFALFLTFFLGLFILLGTWIVFLTKNNEKFISFSLSLAFGVVISLSFFELLPESYEHLKENNDVLTAIFFFSLFLLIGMVILKILDYFIPHHALDEGHHHSQKEHMHHLYHISIVSSVTLILHNIIEGMAIFGTASSSISLGILIGLGVGLHNIPMGMIIASTFYKSSGNKQKTMWMSFVISISTFIGGLSMFLLKDFMKQDFILGILLSLTFGMLLYIVLFELLGQVVHTKNKKETTLGFILALFLFILNLLLGHHH